MRRLVVGLGAAILCAAMAPGAARADAKKVPDGKPVFIKYKCGSCHTIESQGIGKKPAAAAAARETPAQEAAEVKPVARKPPDLSDVGGERNAKWIAAFMKKQEAIDGRKHMKLFRGTDAELATLAGWLETLKTEKPAKGGAEKSGK
ncbi:MAG TPA: c-type cytochrome [Candidatus Limnocylindrales bacterium]|nr:c-type cytochrome [Candidatus Limnocylindrales bacterium]